MGIVNVTPDSFSDGGRYTRLDAALIHARALIAAGADIIDIGGESTRPGAKVVPDLIELRRVTPLIEALRAESRIALSIDTTKPGVARAAVAAGATMWNDVQALRAPGALSAAVELGCDVVLMHMQGEPHSMQTDPHYQNVVDEVVYFLSERAKAAMEAGVMRHRIRLDPGIGFGKTLEHNLALTKGLPKLGAAGFPVVFGASRKRMIRALDPLADDACDRLGGSIALALAAATRGASILRVHDVRETVQALKVWRALDQINITA